MKESSKKKLDKNTTGVSLIEVCISITIISMGVIGLYDMVLATIRGTSFNKNLMTATVLSQDKLERIKAADFDDIIEINYPVENYNTMADFEQFERVVTVDPTTPPGANTKSVFVTVSWKTKSGTTRNVHLGTIITQ